MKTLPHPANDGARDLRALLADRRMPRRTVRRAELRQLVPLSDTTIYELEQKGEFPRRFYLSPRCVVWDLGEVIDWLDERRRLSDEGEIDRAPDPDVRQRRTRPVR
ncbi:MAG: transcriptional regulator [Hirschia sp.]|mgnify:CR=1 FL=1|nr:transcriptional regulator [Hirschia sp.]MBF16912.1 transcriptional regulator [Hirschia sp.]